MPCGIVFDFALLHDAQELTALSAVLVPPEKMGCNDLSAVHSMELKHQVGTVDSARFEHHSTRISHQHLHLHRLSHPERNSGILLGCYQRAPAAM